MKALTLTEPFASFVVHGEKKIETRSWSTPYRGPIAIHAAKGFTDADAMLCFLDPYWSVLREIGIDEEYYRSPVKGSDRKIWASVFPLGCVIATATLRDVVRVRKEGGDYVELYGGKLPMRLTGREKELGDYSVDRWLWLFDDVKRLPEQIPAKGALGLWDWYAQGVACGRSSVLHVVKNGQHEGEAKTYCGQIIGSGWSPPVQIKEIDEFLCPPCVRNWTAAITPA